MAARGARTTVIMEEYAVGETPERRAALEKLVGYFVKHTTRLDYAERY
jgi:hypothetical protein